MITKFTESFKQQAVKKTLTRTAGVSIKETAATLGMGYSTLQTWVRKSKQQTLETVTPNNILRMKQEKRPQDWSLQERLDMVVNCASLDEAALSAHCRQQGIYPHHLAQWKNAFANGKTCHTDHKMPSDIKTLKQENKALKKELNRKNKALAETAALLVLQKKVQQIWGCDEGDLL